MSHDVVDFTREVLERSHQQPVLVDFWAAWCGPCRVLGPVLEKLAGEANGRWVLAKVDTDAQPEWAGRYGVQGIPAVKLFVNGKVADEFTGALPEPHVRRWLERALPSPQAARMAGVLDRIERGEFAAVIPELRDVVAAEPGFGAARIALGRALLHEAPGEVRAAVEPLEGDEEHGDRAAALETLAGQLVAARTPDGLPDSPGRTDLLAALEAVRAADWPAAFEALVALLGRRQDPAAAQARGIGRSIFVLLGIDHPVCQRYHRAYSSALHA